MKNTKRLVPALFLIAAVFSLGADWQQFRGTNGNGVAEAVKLPTDWDESLAWKAALPGRGPSSPIVVGDRVFVTSSAGVKQDRLHVLCFNASTGRRIWQRQFWATGRTFCHPTSAVAAPTPASDGERIFAFYSSNDLVCLDLEGNLQWYRGLARERPRAGNDVGMASSPLVVGDVVVVQVECQGDPFAMAIDRVTGKTRWTVKRRPMANWSSPILFRRGDDNLVLLQSPWGITAHEASTGRELWSHEASCGSVASAVVYGSTVYVPVNGITALNTESKSKNGVSVAWNENRLQPSGASPTVHQGKIFAISRAGVLACGELAAKKVAWQVRLKGHHYASPIGVGDKILTVSDNGNIAVVGLGDEGKVETTHELGERVITTPAVASDGIYIRSDQHLWKFKSSDN
ncbi:MAG: PQQ-binding-like beta-propeller repeat protein [Pirellulales bacterium]